MKKILFATIILFVLAAFVFSGNAAQATGAEATATYDFTLPTFTELPDFLLTAMAEQPTSTPKPTIPPVILTAMVTSTPHPPPDAPKPLVVFYVEEKESDTIYNQLKIDFLLEGK